MKVLFETTARVHSSQESLLRYPPRGWEMSTSKSLLDPIVGNSFIFDKLRLQVLEKVMPLSYVKSRVDSLFSTQGSPDLVYSYNHLIHRSVPWVVHLEWFHIPVGRGLHWFPLFKSLLEKALGGTNCVGISLWTNLALDFMKSHVDCSSFIHKVRVIPPCVIPPSIDKKEKVDYSTFLFIGSPQDPRDFEIKGGHLVLKAFEIFRNHHKGSRLVIRALVPREYLLKAGRLGGVEFLSYLSKEQLDALYRKAYAFIFPSFLAHNTVVLEAMSYGVPVITTYIGSSFGEYVVDGYTGLVSPSPISVDFFKEGFLTSETTSRYSLLNITPQEEASIVGNLVRSMEALWESSSLYKRLSSNCIEETHRGKFSIQARNKALEGMVGG